MTLVVTVVATGDVFDTVDLDGDELSYATGAIQGVFEAQGERSGLEGAQLYAAMDGWSNGYLAVQEAKVTTAGHDPELCTCMDGGRNHGKPGPCPGWVDALPESHPRRVARRERAAERTFERMTRDAPRGTRRRREPEADPHEARREWQRRVDLLRDRAETLAKVEEQLYKDVDDDRVLSHVINAANRKHDFSNDPVMAPLLTADVSDRAALRATVRQAAQELGMTRVGGERLVTIQNRFGDFEVERGHYRRGVMQPLGGERIREGEPVDVIAPGFTAVVDGQEVTLVPAVVAKAELGAGEAEIGETAMSATFDEPVVAADRTYVRDDDGRFDDVPGVGADDKLKLGRKTPPGVSVAASRKVKSSRYSNKDLMVAEVNTPDGPRVHVGAFGTDGRGKWDGGLQDQATQDQIASLRAEIDRISSDDELYDDDRIEELEEEIIELGGDDGEGNRTAALTPEQVSALTGQLASAMDLATRNKAKQDRVVAELDALYDRRRAVLEGTGAESIQQQIDRESAWLRGNERSIASLSRGDHSPLWDAETVAELIERHRATAAERRATIADLEGRRAQLVNPAKLAEVDAISQQIYTLNDDEIDAVLTGGEVVGVDGKRVAFETSGSDDEDEDWVSTEVAVLGPGMTFADAHDSDETVSFRGLKGLRDLMKGLSGSPTTAAASPGGNLLEYWVHGEGAAKIRWGTDGAFKRCVRQLRKYSEGETEFDTEGLCANMYREATGRWPGSKKNSSILVAAARRYKRDSEGRFAKTAAQVVKELDELMARLASLKSSIADDYDEDSGVNLDDALDAMRELRERQAEKAERREALMDSQDYGEINIYLHQDGDVGVAPDSGAEEWFTSAENARELAAGIDDLRKKMPPTPTPGVAGMFETADGSVYARAWNSGDVEIGLTSDRDAPLTDEDDEDEVVPSIVVLRSEEATEFADLLEEMANRSMGEDEPVTAAYRDYAADELLDDGPCLPCLEPQPGEMWHAVFHTEGMSTGARVWEPGALSWREPPFAFHWEKEAPAHGGTPRVVQVGNVLRVLREGTRLHAWGNLDIESEDGAEVARKLEKGFLRWISMGPGSEKIIYEQVWPANVDASQMGRVEPEQTIFIDYRIGELTAVSVPAQEGGFIEPVGELAREITTASGSSWTIEIPDLPPAWWFDKPVDMPKNAAVTVTDEGRIYGYLAPANSGHRSYARNGERKTLAHLPKTDYSRWLKETIVAGGGRVLAGPVTMECMHAPTQGYGQLERRHQYYEDSCSIIARVNIGEDPDDGARWIAGAMMPGVTADQFLKFLSSDVSLDQQPHPDIPGVQDFVGILAVPVGGWPKSRTTASVPVTRMEETPDGAVMVASAVPVRHETMGEELVEQLTIATHDPALCTCMDGGPNHGMRGPCPGWKGKRQTPSLAPEPGDGRAKNTPKQNRVADAKRRKDQRDAVRKDRDGAGSRMTARARERREVDRIAGMRQAQFIQHFEDFLNSDEEVTEADERVLRQALEAKGPKVLEALAKELPTTRDNLPGGMSHEKLVERIMRGTVGIKMAAQRARARNTGLEITPEVFASIVGVDLGAVVRNNAAMFATSLGGV